MRRNLIAATLGAPMAGLVSTAASPDGIVNVTPLGGQDSELCREDPNDTYL